MKRLLQKASIRLKLWLLAGVPVVGALLLAFLIVRDARRQAAKAEAIGSIESLAALSAFMTDTLRAVQAERAATALADGLRVRPAHGLRPDGEPPAELNREAAIQSARSNVDRTRAVTDQNSARLRAFLSTFDPAKLPPRLATDQANATARLGTLEGFRRQADTPKVTLDDVLGRYNKTAESLIRSTAHLSELTDDGELLRSIQSLVAILELTERSSRQHALLAHAFAASRFAPGAFKVFVTLVTEEQIYRESFLANASDTTRALYEASGSDPEVNRAEAMRRAALESTDDTFEVDYGAWVSAGQAVVDRFEALEHEAMGGMKRRAAEKVASTQSTVRLGVGLSVLVLVVSMALGLYVMQGISRSVHDLSDAAANVRETRDYRTRARKTSEDELGVLTDTFNEMLAGIGARDAELEGHRKNLEALVLERTRALDDRNKAMRLVLDNVDQALATIRVDGTMESERSAEFDRLFGAPALSEHFANRIASHDPKARALSRLSWDVLVEGVMPPEVVLEQFPKNLERDGKHLTVEIKPMRVEEEFRGALLIISDVTATVEATREQEKQREYIMVFERAMRDRAGLVEFVAETSKLVEAIVGDNGLEDRRLMRLLHTVKGNAAQWDVLSVAKVAHELETQIVDEVERPTDEQLAMFSGTWKTFVSRVAALVDAAGSVHRVEVSRRDLEAVIELVRRPKHDPRELEKAVDRLRHEPTRARFERVKDQAASLARQLGKPPPAVIIEPNDVRLPASRFAPFWQSLVHIIRNAMDHGIETPDVRRKAGKPGEGTITLRSIATPGELILEVGDDGTGIDWDKIRERATQLGLRTATQLDLEAALFAPGVSTMDKLTELSGRGVGLGAAREECAKLGGCVEITTQRGKGTKFSFRFPRQPNETSVAPVATAEAIAP